MLKAIAFGLDGTITLPGANLDEKNKNILEKISEKYRIIIISSCSAEQIKSRLCGINAELIVTPASADKYTALDSYCREAGLSHSEVIFVGSGYTVGGSEYSIYRSDFRFVTTDHPSHLDEVLAPWLDESVQDVNGLLGTGLDCACGMHHSCDIRKVIIRRGAVNELPALTADYSSILLVCDENTRRVCGDMVDVLLADRISSRIIYSGDGFLIPDEKAISELEACITDETDLIVGVGSGVINDLCKHVSYQNKLPYCIVATAPSMDGYASKGAAMLLGSMKITTNAAVPMAIIADPEILKDAPIEMLRAGYGDIIGKYSCLNDWRLSHTVNDELFCEYIYKIVYDTVISIAGMGKAISSRDEESIAALMRALVVVGIAMAYIGNSRPASGSEHHLSHYFEVTGLVHDEPYFCHGVDVAYSTYLTAKLRRELLSIEVPEASDFDYADWEKNIRRVYSSVGSSAASDGIIELQNKLGWIHRDMLPIYREKWEDIRRVLADSPTPEQILDMLESVGLDINEFYEMYTPEKLADGVRYAKDLKDRYTVLWLYEQVK